MNQFNGIGRLVRDPDISEKAARYTLAIDRNFKNSEGKVEADFISCVVFGKGIDFVSKFLHKGMKIGVTGSIRTGSFEKDGVKHYTTDVVVQNHYFCESRNASANDSEASYHEPKDISELDKFPEVSFVEHGSDEPDLPF